MMGNERAVPETKGVTVQLLATVDLGPEIESFPILTLLLVPLTNEVRRATIPLEFDNVTLAPLWEEVACSTKSF